MTKRTHPPIKQTRRTRDYNAKPRTAPKTTGPSFLQTEAETEFVPEARLIRAADIKTWRPRP